MLEIILFGVLIILYVLEIHKANYWKKKYFELQDKYRELKNNDISAIYDDKEVIFQHWRDMGIEVTDVTKEMEGTTSITLFNKPQTNSEKSK
jgi:hypothetical protein